MGAWGLGLFQSNHDNRVLRELDDRSELTELDVLLRGWQIRKLIVRNQAGDQAATNAGPMPQPPNRKWNELVGVFHGAKRLFNSIFDGGDSYLPAVGTVRPVVKKGENRVEAFVRHDFHHSVYARVSSCPWLVKVWLDLPLNEEGDSPTRLQHLIEEYTRNTEEEQMLRNPFGAGYKTVILGACLMSLGCSLPDSFRALLERIYPHVGLMRNGRQQMETALHGPHGYEDGVPYDFGSLDQHEMSAAGGAPLEDRKYPRADLPNVPSPDEFAPAEAIEKLDPRLQRGLHHEMSSMKALGGDEVTTCGECGASHGEKNAKLLLCARCKKVKYCGSDCQRQAWNWHKGVCSKIAKNLPGKVHIHGVENASEQPGWKDDLMAPPDLLTKMTNVHKMSQGRVDGVLTFIEELKSGPKRAAYETRPR